MNYSTQMKIMFIIVVLSLAMMVTMLCVGGQRNVDIHINVIVPESIEPGESVEKSENLPEPVLYFDVPLSENLQDHIFEVCKINDIDPAMVVAIIDRESKFKSDAIGDSGRSLGLMQVQPKWHQGRMDSLGCDDLLDPYQNVTVGVDILKELSAEGKSDAWVLMAYNGGRSHANKNAARGIVSDYASTVLNNREKLSEI